MIMMMLNCSLCVGYTMASCMPTQPCLA